MATFNVTPNAAPFRVVHPLDDVQEAKCSSEGLGRIQMSTAVRVSLRVLRGYLLLMTLLLLYHVCDLAGMFTRLK